MDISVKTKFNPGDVVYIVETYYDHWYAIRDGFNVLKVQVYATQDKCRIDYELKSTVDDLQLDYAEQWCFATYDKAVEWCTKQNRVGE